MLPEILGAASTPARRPAHVFAVTSGKGGVGKTNVVANLAAALALAGRRVMVLDADLGLANLDLFLGVEPGRTLADFFAGRCSLGETVRRGRLGILLVPAASGVQEVTALTDAQKIALLTELDGLAESVDVVLVDTGSGISDTVTYFASAAHDIVVVVTPEPTALTDGYALIKVLASTRREKRFWILVNSASSEREARRVYDRLARTALSFLNIALDFLGWVPRDEALARAVASCRIAVMEGRAPAALSFLALARRLGELAEGRGRLKGSLQFFFRQLLAAERGAA